MKESEMPMRSDVIARRDFLRVGTDAAFMMAILNADIVSAQEQGKPWWDTPLPKTGVRPPVSIDMHAHWTPEPYLKELAGLGRPMAKNPLNFDLAERVKWMDRRAVKIHVLTLDGNPPWPWASPEESVRLARVLNDAAVAAHTAYPDRFIGSIAIPVRKPALALEELNRVARRPGLRAVNLPNSIKRRDYLFEPEFAPILARCEELEYPLLLHPIGVPQDRLVGPPSLNTALDFAFENAVTAAKFITSGTLDKFPKLNIVLPHAGGAFPYLAGRIEHFLYHMGRASEVTLARPFREYLRRFHYDYLTYHPEGFRFLLSLVGSDRIVLGTDVFAANDIDYPNGVIEQFGLSARDRDLILRSNAMRLLQLSA